jgi:hypothetical protein
MNFAEKQHGNFFGSKEIFHLTAISFLLWEGYRQLNLRKHHQLHNITKSSPLQGHERSLSKSVIRYILQETRLQIHAFAISTLDGAD